MNAGMHRRATTSHPASSKSSKVAASRERRARRNKLNETTNGNHHHHGLHGHQHGPKARFLKRVVLLTVFLLLVCLLVVWGGALYRVSINSSQNGSSNGPGGDSTSNNVIAKSGDEEDSASHPKTKISNGLRRFRTNLDNDPNSNVEAHSNNNRGLSENPYTPTALSKNPYLGWQPPLLPSPLGDAFSWRQCFKAEASSDGTDQPEGCRENPEEIGDAPKVNPDWVPDVTMVRSMMMYGKDVNGNEFPPPLPHEMCEDIAVRGGNKGDTNKDCLRESMIRPTGALNSTTVTIHPSNHYEVRKDGGKESTLVVPAPKLMCLVYTMANAHANRIRAMRDTWAGGCDGFLAFSTQSDPRLPTISLEHEGPESYDNMWQKVRSIWRFVGTNYLEDFDWFFIGGDDLFVMPHNLKTYLASLTYKDGTDPKSKEYFVGRRFNSGGKDYFNSGGAGYALSQATLRKYLANMNNSQNCMADKRTSMEDVMIARCLRYLGIQFSDTRDAEGRERFHPFAPGTHLHWKPPGPNEARDWYEDYNKEWGILTGKDCCAPDSVSFHYVKKASMVRHMHALLHFCGGN